MRGAKRWTAGVLMVIVAAACGPAPGDGPTPRGSARLISREEIAGTPATTVYELVQRLRPGWLQPRAAQGRSGYPAVFLGSLALGGLEHLRGLETGNVAEVRFLDPVEATSRFGLNVPFGVIQVVADVGG